MSPNLPEQPVEYSPDDLRKRCWYCGLAINDGERVIAAETGNAWAHFTCWYDDGPFEREVRERESRGAAA